MDSETPTELTTDPSSTKRPFFRKRPSTPFLKSGKRGKFTPRSTSTPVSNSNTVPANKQAPHGGLPTYDKATKPQMVSIVPQRTAFSVYVGTTGLHRFCTEVRDTLATKDNQNARLISSELLTYVALVCTYYRMMLTAAKYGFVIAKDISKVARIVHDVKLPVAICEYIESIGSVKLASGVTVIPSIARSLEQLLDVNKLFDALPAWHVKFLYTKHTASHYYTDHREFEEHLVDQLKLDNNGRVETFDPIDFYNEDDEIPMERTEWDINPQIISKYRRNLRADKVGLGFRAVNYEELTGRQEMLVSPDVSRGILTPTAPESMPAEAAAIGSTYFYRTSDSKTWLPSNGNYLLQGRSLIGTAIIDVNGTIAAHVANTLRV